MPDEDSTDHRIEMLRRRWQEDPNAHLSLQLADLYRQGGQVAEGVPVLERCLEDQPGHVSVLVALGRYRLEAGDAGAAEEVLRSVVDGDPSHLVANKLLVRAYLALDEGQRAADRLELYALLNDSDPELGTLRAAVAAELTEEASGTRQPVESSDPPATARLSSRKLTGWLDREPFADLLATPLESMPIADLFARESGDGDRQIEEAPTPSVQVVPTLPADYEPADPFQTQFLERERPRGDSDEYDERLAPREVDAGSAATSTLGALYLAQGHLEDAQATFEQVLEREPGDAEALAGLRELDRRRSTDKQVETAVEVGENDTKIAALQRYLGRIRAASDLLSARGSS